MKSKELKVQEIFIWVVQSALIRQDPRGVFLSLLKEHEGGQCRAQPDLLDSANDGTESL